MQCLCGNDQLDSFNQYFDDDNDTLIGLNCISCEQEWLRPEYLNQSGENRIIFNGHSLTEQKNPLEKEQEQFQVKSSRTIIEADNCHILKPGDHISWHRPYIIWHHAIVEKIDLVNNRIEVICYNKVENTENKYQVVAQSTSLEEEWGKLYRIDYSKEVTDKNPPKLSLSRARSKLGETKYGFLSNNCESFAAFCKTGVSYSCQVRWLWGKIKEACGAAVGQLAKGASKAVYACSKGASNATIEKALESAGKLTAAEMIEHAINASNYVGAGIVILLESGFLIWDLNKIYEKRRDGNLSLKDFLETGFQRFAEYLVGAGLAIAGSLVGEGLGGTAGAAIGTAIMPVIGTAVGASFGAFVGSVIGGALGAIGGKLSGSLTSPGIAKSIDLFKIRDNRAVKDINELEKGDQVVFSRSLLHPRHYAIVVDIDISKNKVRVIHNTYTKGVIEEWIESETPLIKVIYKSDSSRHAESVMERAKSKLGSNVYNFFYYNCEHFANWCKEVITDDVSLVSKSKL